MSEADASIKSLTDLLMDPDLEELEFQIAQFNIFEAIGVRHQEIRHSAFLAFLLDPAQRHGLGDTFARKFLQSALRGCSENQPLSPVDLDLWSLDQLSVRREWKNIDILLEDPINEFVVIIENKVFTFEHDNQLQKYWSTIQNNFPRYKKLGIYLSPTGEGFSGTEGSYISLTYSDVHSIIDQILNSKSSILGSEIITLLRHYNVLLERHIMDNPKIDELCQQIYKKHKQAIDMIVERCPDKLSNIRDIILDQIRQDSRFDLGSQGITYISFRPKEWNTQKLQGENGWILLFEIRLYGDQSRGKYELFLVIGPGDAQIRMKLYEMAKNYTPLKAFRSFGSTYNTIWKHVLIEWNDEDLETDMLQAEFIKNWNQFVQHHYHEIVNIIKNQNWIWV